METLSLILVFGGLLVAIVASIGLFVVAFRVSIVWFIVCFLPFGKLVFSLAHWDEARGMVITYFVGIAMMLAGVVVDPNVDEDDGNPLHAIGRVFRSGKQKDAPRRQSPAKTLVTREERITELQAQLAKETADLNVIYRDLSTRRAALKPGNEKAISDYNTEAARYSALLESTKKVKAELDALMVNPK